MRRIPIRRFHLKSFQPYALYGIMIIIMGTTVSPGPADSDPPFINDTDRNPHYPINRRSESATPVGAASQLLGTDPLIEKLQKEYYSLRKKYIKACDDLLDAERMPKIDLSKPENLKVMINTLKFWEGKKLKSHAFCVMPNHVHWAL